MGSAPSGRDWVLAAIARYSLAAAARIAHAASDCGLVDSQRLPAVYQQQITNKERQYVEEVFGDYFNTDGYTVYIFTEDDDEKEITEKVPQHKSLQNTLAACLFRLQATYECNHEVMDADDIGDLLTTIEDVKYYMNQNI